MSSKNGGDVGSGSRNYGARIAESGPVTAVLSSSKK